MMIFVSFHGETEHERMDRPMFPYYLEDCDHLLEDCGEIEDNAVDSNFPKVKNDFYLETHKMFKFVGFIQLIF